MILQIPKKIEIIQEISSKGTGIPRLNTHVLMTFNQYFISLYLILIKVYSDFLS